MENFTKIGKAAIGAVDAAQATLDAKVPGASDMAKDQLNAARDRAQSAGNHVADMAQQQASGMQDQFQQMVTNVKTEMEKQVKMKVYAQITKIVNKIPGTLHSCTDDPDMPGCVMRGKNRLIDSVWPDVKEELMWEVAVMMDGKKQDDPNEPDESTGPDCIRAFFRYHIFPYDRTIWGKLRDPVWLMFTLLSLVPVAGVSPLIFLFIFVILDKTDEFQLIFFILSFKGTQFISHGIVRTLLGFFTFVNCVVADADETHTCQETGPGILGNFYVVLAGYLGQVCLVWIAFMLLPFSKEKGRTTLKIIEAEDVDRPVNQMQGGYLKWFLLYDLFWFFLCTAAVVYVATQNGENALEHWTVKITLFSAQVMYGYLSMPFFLFTLPFFQNVLTHAVPTAYDDQGRCKKLRKPKSRKQKRDEYVVEEKEPFVSMADVDKVTDKVKEFVQGVVPGGALDLSKLKARGQQSGQQGMQLGPQP